ncbi:MAG: dihydroxy-acid dehydratase, partial [Planctomycetia bacterium]
IVKATAIDPKTFSAEGVYRHTGPARVFTSERAAIAAIKAGRIAAGDVLVLAGIGPMGTGMEETYQVTSALKQLPIASRVAVITDARFSGVSTGACIGHASPEALAGGPIGKLVEGDVIAIEIDTRAAVGTVELVAHGSRTFTPAEAAAELARRPSRPDLAPDPKLPADTRVWSLLQSASGGVWAGCVYDESRIAASLRR